MTKEQLIQKIKEGNPDKQTILNWIVALPRELSNNQQPVIFKKGDVIFHNCFQHPVVIVKSLRKYFIGIMLTSNEECLDIFRKCNSRFFSNSYLTKHLLHISKEDTFRFRGIYENNKDLTIAYNQIKNKL